MTDKKRLISLWSWLVVLGYIAFGLFTLISIAIFDQAVDLFRQTEFLMQFNLIWFSLIIVIYGVYALYQNISRIRRMGLNDAVNTQFLIVFLFVFILISVSLDFIVYLASTSPPSIELSAEQIFAFDSTAKVFLYGSLVSGLLSIILPKLIFRNRGN